MSLSLGVVLVLVAAALLLVDVVLSSLALRAERRHALRAKATYAEFQRQWEHDRDRLYITLLKLESSVDSMRDKLQTSATSVRASPEELIPYPPSPANGPVLRAYAGMWPKDASEPNGNASVTKRYASFADVTAARLEREANTVEELEDELDNRTYPGHA